MAFSSLEPSQRDEFLAFASVIRSQPDVQRKLYSLETRSERISYIESLGFNPEMITNVINSIEFTFGGKKVSYRQWLESKGIDNKTPLPLNVIVSAMRKSGFSDAYDQLSQDVEKYISGLAGYSGGAGVNVKATTSVRAPKKDTEAVDNAGDVNDIGDRSTSEEAMNFVSPDSDTRDASVSGESGDKSESTTTDKGIDLTSETFESTDKESDTSTSRDSVTTRGESTDDKSAEINSQVDKFSAEHSDLQSSYTSEQSKEISKTSSDFKEAVNNLKEEFDKGDISRTEFFSSLTAETNKAFDSASTIAPQEAGNYGDLKDGLLDSIKSAESGESTGTSEGDESSDKDSGSDSSDSSSSDSWEKGLKDPDVWIGAVVGAVGIEAVKSVGKGIYEYYKSNS